MAIEVDIERRLGDFRLQTQFAGEPGITALFGRSGAGKSSVVNMISGLLTPGRGRIAVDGRVLFDSRQKINAPPRKRRIGTIFQESRLFPHLKVRNNLLYGQRFTPRRERYASLEQIVDILGIGHLLERRPSMLSGGERQRVAIGRALLSSPRLLLMDEPLASLDEARKNEILPYVERLRDELALPIVYVSHQFEEVTRLADMLVVMDAGRVAAAGPLTEVTSRLGLRTLTGRDQAGTVVETRVADHDTGFGLTRLSCRGGQLVVPQLDRLEGARVRVHIHALDVAVAVNPPAGISIQNVLPARIAEVAHDAGPYVELRLDANGMPIIAYVTEKSVQELGLAPGQAVFALIKSVAVDRDREPAPTDVIEHLQAR